MTIICEFFAVHLPHPFFAGFSPFVFKNGYCTNLAGSNPSLAGSDYLLALTNFWLASTFLKLTSVCCGKLLVHLGQNPAPPAPSKALISLSLLAQA